MKRLESITGYLRQGFGYWGAAHFPAVTNDYTINYGSKASEKAPRFCRLLLKALKLPSNALKNAPRYLDEQSTTNPRPPLKSKKNEVSAVLPLNALTQGILVCRGRLKSANPLKGVLYYA